MRKKPRRDLKTVPDIAREETWFTVLGVSSSATIEDVKQAYRVMIKQNHPDRVHNMSPVFKELAESETRKLNDAYAEALTYFQQVNWSRRKASAAGDARHEDEMVFG